LVNHSQITPYYRKNPSRSPAFFNLIPYQFDGNSPLRPSWLLDYFSLRMHYSNSFFALQDSPCIHLVRTKTINTHIDLHSSLYIQKSPIYWSFPRFIHSAYVCHIAIPPSEIIIFFRTKMHFLL